jgi:hypothetical protein
MRVAGDSERGHTLMSACVDPDEKRMYVHGVLPVVVLVTLTFVEMSILVWHERLGVLL